MSGSVSSPSAAFASDNCAPAHPAAINAVIAANHGPAMSYGDDAISARAAERVKSAFQSPDAEVLFAFTGTGANITALSSATRPWQEILCSDIAHALIDEAGGPVRLSGAPLTPLPSADGIIDPAHLDRLVTMRRGDVHHSQPRVVTITQSTENGRVWPPALIADFIDHAHALDLIVHVDGARVANAVAALDTTPKEAIGDADIVTVGGTKNGMLFGEAILVRRPELFEGIHFAHKQIGHLASKQRFVAAQFDALFADDQWLRLARHANAMAARLSAGLVELGLTLAAPTEANEVFVTLAPEIHAELSKRFVVHQPDPLRPVVRLVCSWETTPDQVDEVLTTLRAHL